MKTSCYVKKFKSESDAMDWMKMQNAAFRLAGNWKSAHAVVAGPQNDWAVVDLKTAIELGTGYTVA